MFPKDETSAAAIETTSGSGSGIEGDGVYRIEAAELARVIEELEIKSKKKWYAYLQTREFYAVLLLGYSPPELAFG
jgi:hypothetical protein